MTWIVVAIPAAAFVALTGRLGARKVGWKNILLLSLLPAAGLTAGLLAAKRAARPQDRHITMSMRQWAYDPAVIRVNKGDRVHLTLYSRDVTHGFYLDGSDIKVEVPGGGAKREVEFLADKTGRFGFRCAKTCGVFHPFMMGMLIVEPNYLFPISIGLAFGFLWATLWYLSMKGTLMEGEARAEPAIN